MFALLREFDIEMIPNLNQDDAQLNLLELLLEDISHIEPIRGRDEYLLLTRRIERGRLLLRMAGSTFEITFQRLQTILGKLLDKFNVQCQLQGTPELVASDFEKQVEEFIDNPRLLVPPALACSLGHPALSAIENREQFEKLGWRCFYLLALFPPDLRASALTAQPSDAILKHFRIVAQESKQARQRLIEGTLRYILRSATSYMGRGLPFLDLVQEGYFGLQHAADRFIEQEGAHFQQYAGQWIQQRMMRAIGDKARLIRVPVHLQEKLAQLKQIEREYENDLVLYPHSRDQEIIERLGLASAQNAGSRRGNGAWRLRKLREANARYYPIDLGEIGDLLIDEQSVEEFVEMSLLNEQITVWLLRLPERERNIVALRNGLTGDGTKTLEEIGQRYGLTRERVRQIEAKVYRLLRKKQTKYFLDGSLPETDHRISTAINDLYHALYDGLDTFDMRAAFLPNDSANERHRVEQLIDQHLFHGKKRLTRRHVRASRAGLLADVLTAHGHPLHYAEIYEQVLAALPPEAYFTKEAAYSTLFYNDQFRSVGGGVFALASWQST